MMAEFDWKKDNSDGKTMLELSLMISLNINMNLWTYNGIFVFVALCPMSTAMVIAGRSVHLTTLFPGQAWASG